MAPAKVALKRNPRSWDALATPLAQWILDAVQTLGFPQMTPVQAATIPHFMGNKDVVVEVRFAQAVTGSGKTIAFLLPVVQRILRLEEPTKKHHVAAIIVSPTRELAAQIHTVLLSLLEFHAPSAEILPYLKDDEKRPSTAAPVIVPQLLVGGTTSTAQDAQFFMRHSPNVLISSPGRLVELLSSPHVHCPQSSFEMLVLDEADRLLDLGFKQDLQGIISQLPKQRRTGLFSASVSEAVSEIIRVGLRNPVKIVVRVKMKDGGVLEDRKTPASLKMTYMVTPATHKLPALAQLLEKLPIRPQRTIVFLSTCAAVDYFQHVLPGLLLPAGFSLIPLHGKHPAKVREKNFAKFLGSVSPTVLVTTDLAARGLDIPQVDLVVQMDPPSDPKVFIHRSGRAGRAGRKGLAVVMLHPGREEDYVRFLEIRKTPIVPLDRPQVAISEDTAAAATEKMRKLAGTDRAIYDKAQRAFVSWVRSYSAHQATSIFRVADLDWADLANAWGLLRLPRMPELKNWKGDKTLGVEMMDWDAFAYKDKARERARQEALEAQRNGAVEEQRKADKSRKRKNEAWSNKTGHEEQRVERREKRHKRKEAEKKASMTEEEKLDKAKLDELIRRVREQNLAKAAAAKDDEFEGFDD
uniref:ATP-dependent RNA helicase n=2 Tax=Epichloe TaxID=5112 RepID=A0A0F7J1R6_EPIFI|nr:DEAD/DEAH box helicase [Epichloe festucae var. lolii]AKH04997.1 DEAD/DEAH box helicase [Epichloe sp. LpTG-2]AKH04980.1 DEAD/DEAH box helicase [Epichloe festucae var. lolii]AKH04981.1 DEAD/DEAH box helicase [Epichloe festucae var. lolii]AKH04982.1 DEAD/DEAH box helicase [Epichloe festucae var. lolii]